MTNLTNQAPQSTYGDLLTTTNNGLGLTTVLQQVQDGFGNASAISLSTEALNVSGDLQLGNVTITSTALQINNATNPNPSFLGTNAMLVPSGTTAQRPGVPVNGDLRYNTTINNFEFYVNGAWVTSLGTGTVTSIGITPPASGITVAGSPITTSGSITLALADDLLAVESLSTFGLATRTALSTWTTRTLTAGNANLAVTNGTGVSGNPTVTLATTITGLTSVAIGNLTISANQVLATNVNGDVTLMANGSGAVRTPNDLRIESGGSLIIYDNVNNLYTKLRTSASGATVTYTFPLLAPTVSGQILASTTAGAMSWTSVGAGTITSLSQGANIVLTPNPIVATGSVALNPILTGITSIAVGSLLLSGNDIITTDPNDDIFLAPNGTGTIQMQSNVHINAAGLLKFFDTDNSAFVAFKSAAVLPGDTTWTLPSTDSTGTQALVSNGTGTLSWATYGGGSVTGVSGTANRITVVNGTTTPVIDISAAYVGQTSITTLGAVTTGTWTSTPVQLAYGGTNANLTASNGGIFYSTATAGAILAGTATANQMLLSGSSTTPAWSTVTHPATTTINQILYSSSNNAIAGLATANRGVLTTGTTGIPVITALATDGQIIIGSTAGVPSAATLTAGTGIAITNASNSITIAVTSAGFTWTTVTGATQTLAVENGYITNRGGGVTYTLPASAAVGDEIKIVGQLGLTTVAQNANQQILLSSGSTTVGIAGSIVGTNVGDCVTLVCITAGASTVWRSNAFVGNWTIV